MPRIETQIGEMLSGDFLENTLTFEMEKDAVVQAGKYAIVPIEEYNKLTNACEGCISKGKDCEGCIKGSNYIY